MFHRISRAGLVLLASLLLPLPGHTQAPSAAPAAGSSIAALNRIQAKTYRFAEAGRDMPYELYVPTTYDPTRSTPLIIALHGLGSNPTQMIRYQGLVDLAEERGYLVVAPMGYNTRGWYGSRGEGRASMRGEAANDPDNLGALSEKDVMNVLQIVRGDYNVDPERIFLMGHSMGGGGTWHIAMKNPDLFAAIAPVAPAIYSSPAALIVIRELPVIVVMGDADALVRVDVTRQWVAKMEELGMRYSYVEIPGGDHTGIIARNPANMRKIFDFFDEVADR